MCGRFRLAAPWREIAELFDLDDGEARRNVPARYNVAPSQDIPIVIDHDGDRRSIDAKWGLVPHWAKPDKAVKPQINARGETVHEKPFFRQAFASRRCLVPADGWYEWIKEADGRQPYLIERPDETPFAFAGIWSRTDVAGESVAIVTVAAAPSIAKIHSRMPAVMTSDGYQAWLDPETSRDDARALLSDVQTSFQATPVSRAINAARYTGQPEPINPK